MDLTTVIPQRIIPEKSLTPSDINLEDHNGMILVCDAAGNVFGFIIYINGKWIESAYIDCTNPNYEDEDLNHLMNDILKDDDEIVFKSWIF